jgi:hypothetical protein
MGELYRITIDVDLPTNAIILWMESGTCPAGYTKISTSNFYLMVGTNYIEHTGQDHRHQLDSHSHSWISPGNTGDASGCKSQGISGFLIPFCYSHNHTIGDCGSGLANGYTDYDTSPGLEHVDVVLCKKN